MRGAIGKFRGQINLGKLKSWETKNNLRPWVEVWCLIFGIFSNNYSFLTNEISVGELWVVIECLFGVSEEQRKENFGDSLSLCFRRKGDQERLRFEGRPERLILWLFLQLGLSNTILWGQIQTILHIFYIHTYSHTYAYMYYVCMYF